MTHFHTIVWSDHCEARSFSFGTDDAGDERTAAHGSNIQHGVGSLGAGDAQKVRDYLTAISESLLSAREILIVGHGEAKTTLTHFIRDQVSSHALSLLGAERSSVRQTERSSRSPATSLNGRCQGTKGH